MYNASISRHSFIHMRKKGFIIIASLLFAVSPLIASADAISDLQAQIAALTAQLNQLLAQRNQAQGLTPSTTGQPPTNTNCSLGTRRLALGMKGDDVSCLQTILAQDPSVYPEGTISGSFGVLTEAAVKKFQCKNNIVCSGSPATTGYGLVGAKTRIALYASAGIGGTTSASLTLSPSQVNINQSVTASIFVDLCYPYSLSWGDGSARVTIRQRTATASQRPSRPLMPIPTSARTP